MKNIPLVSFNEELKIMENKFYQIFKKQLKEGDFIGGSSVNIFEAKIQKVLMITTIFSKSRPINYIIIFFTNIKT